MISRYSCLVFLLCFASISIKGQKSPDTLFKDYEKFEEEIKTDYAKSWPVINVSSVNKQVDKYKSLISELKVLESTELEKEDRINVEMLKYILEDRVFNLEFGNYMMPLNSEGGFIISMIYSVRGLNLESEEAKNKYLSKLNDTGRYIDQQIRLMSQGIEAGIIRPKLVVENCLFIIDDLLEKKGSEFFLYKPLEKEYQIIADSTKSQVLASFSRLKRFLSETYLPAAKSSIGITEISNGEAFYDQRLRYFTSLDMNASEVFEVGHSEVNRIRAEMMSVLEALEYEGTLEEFIHFLRTDERFYAKTPEELLYFASWLSKKAEAFLPRYFGHLPRLPFTVTPVPEAIAPNYTSGRYSGGSMESGRPGQYWVNTYKLSSRALYMLPALTLHEAVPGHHLQLSLADELTDLPSFRGYYLSAYGEGWGLYSEFLGKEAGFYSDAYEEFGRLSYEMWRACRLVVDPGMHAFEWSREKAVEFMKSNTALSEHEIETEINRYIGWPGQAVSYKIGELKIKQLREKAEEALGEDFDIKAFHDTILANGSVPLNTLEWIVDDYIKENSNE